MKKKQIRLIANWRKVQICLLLVSAEFKLPILEGLQPPLAECIPEEEVKR